MTVLGTRPEIIRLSRLIPLLDESTDHLLIHTGQNYNPRLSDIFFAELGIREPDHSLGIRGDSFGQHVGALLASIEPLFLETRPDRLLLLGDTNSGLVSVVARRLGIPVYHMEAGNRCFDDRVPEEVNRRVIDHCSSVLLPYTQRSKENLVREGIPRANIFVTGNPIKQVIDSFRASIEASPILARLGLEPQEYVLVTIHRAENVDDPARLRAIIDGLARIHADSQFPVVCSLHPHTRSRVEGFGVDVARVGLRFLEPLGFVDFVRLEQNAWCILTDSGTVQEEACLFGTPNVTVRDVTERPETLEAGSNVLSGANPGRMAEAASLVTKTTRNWIPPTEYMVDNVAETVLRLLLGYRPPDLAEAAWTARSDDRLGSAPERDGGP